MDMHKRSSSTAAIEITDQPPVKQKRLEDPTGASRPSRTWRPRCIFMVEHIRRHRLQFHNRNAAEGEKSNCGIFVSLTDANCRVQDVMEDVVGEFWLSNERGDDSTFVTGSDEYYGNPGYDGEQVGSSWEFDDWQSDVTHKVYVRAFSLVWPVHHNQNDICGGDRMEQTREKKERININEMEWTGV